MKPEWRYLNLIKKALLFTLWDDPGIPFIKLYKDKHGIHDTLSKDVLAGLVDAEIAVNKHGFFLMYDCNLPQITEMAGKMNPYFSDTMVSAKRLNHLQYCVESVLQRDIPGDFIETGVWRGGCCILMRAVLAAYGCDDRIVFVADSFQGLPTPDMTRYPHDEGQILHEISMLAVSREEVEKRFETYGLLDDQVKFIEGWFEETLPVAPIEQLAILRLDGDMYGSTIVALESLYPKLSAGGFCIIDDYCINSCAQAVHDYRDRNGISSRLISIDDYSVYWEKIGR